MAIQHLLNKADACIEWYWRHGIQRQDRYEVARGGWLDPVYSYRDRARSLLRAGQTPKPCMAIWGPSQTGKSTLLSGYLDDPSDERGERSALTWNAAEPVCFVGRSTPDGPVVLNPYNQGADASGCVSRFVLADSVPDPAHPVEVELATEMQIMLALAVAYLTECEMRNSKGERTNWGSDNFRGLLEKAKPSGPPQQAAFEMLHQVAEVVELLILADLSERYKSIGEGWVKGLRAAMFDTPGLLGNVEAVQAFAFELLWDSWPSLTQAFKSLSAKRRDLAGQWGNAKVRCSFRTAGLLLDIDAYKQCEERPDVWRRIQEITARAENGIVTVGSGGGGTNIARSKEDFGLFQGLVWELRIPLRRDVLQQRAPVLAGFLNQADLLDFPGVANAYGSADKRSDPQIAESLLIALTEILKRGKTASIVLLRARNLDIDGFSLLMRMSRFPAQPAQLVSGIKSWLRAFGQQWPPQNKALPINLVLTFSAKLVNDVRQSGIRSGLQASFGQLKDLGALVDPQTVTTFATTYPQFDEGRIHGDEKARQTAVAEITADPAFTERFSGDRASFDAMTTENGGTDFFFQRLGQQAVASRRPALLAERLREAQESLQQHVLMHAPGDSSVAVARDRALNEWDAAIMAKLAEPRASRRGPDNATKLSRQLRTFLNIDPEEIETLPQKAQEDQYPVDEFIERQFREWKALRANRGNFSEMGLRDAAQAQQILSYLIEATDMRAIEQYFIDNLGFLSTRTDRRDFRRFLAVKMSTELLRGPRAASDAHRPVVEGNGTGKLLAELAEAEEQQSTKLETSPHYQSVIRPLRERIEQIKTTGVGNRRPQPGDAEIAAIAQLP
jgi:hypothetical protein